MDENKDLLNEIDSLDDDHVVETKEEPKKEKKAEKVKEPIVDKADVTSRASASSTAILVVVLMVALIIGLAVKYNTKKAEELIKGETGTASKNFWSELKGEEVTEEEALNQEERESFLGGIFGDIFDDEYDEDYDEEDELYSDEDEQKAKEKFQAQKANIAFEDLGLNVNRELMVKIINNNDEEITDLNFYVVFYDAERNIVGIEQEIIYIFAPHQERYVTFEIVPENYEAYDAAFLKDYYYEDDSESLLDKISTRVEEKNGDTYLYVKNNSDKKIENVDLTIVYYDENDKVIGMENTYIFDLRKGKEEKEELYGLYNEETYEHIDYSRLEVKVDEAYIYDI